MSIISARTRSNRLRSNGAFTLIELLVVISIIALLIAILLPSLSKAREAGRRTACLSQTRQIMVAGLMYAADEKGRLPNGWHGTTSGITDTSMSELFTGPSYHTGFYLLAVRYFNSYEAWFCPSNTDPSYQMHDFPWGGRPAGSRVAVGGYSWRFVNEDGQAHLNGAAESMARPDIGQIYKNGFAFYHAYPAAFNLPPSKTVYAYDAISNFVNGSSPSSRVNGHLTGFNGAFMDGHGQFRDADNDALFTSGNITSVYNNYYYGPTLVMDIH